MSFILFFCFTLGQICPSIAFAEEAQNYNLQELAFPNEVKDQGKSAGTIYYSPTVKNKVLVPVSIWGEVFKPGLHFLPIDTSLVKGLTLAGGPTGSSKLNNIKVIRKEGDKQTGYTFDLREGGEAKSHEFALKQGDVVYVERDRFFENRTYYTSLIAVGVSILSGFLIYQRVRDN